MSFASVLLDCLPEVPTIQSPWVPQSWGCVKVGGFGFEDLRLEPFDVSSPHELTGKREEALRCQERSSDLGPPTGVPIYGIVYNRVLQHLQPLLV